MKKKSIKELALNKNVKSILCNHQLLQIVGGSGCGQPGASGTILLRG